MIFNEDIISILDVMTDLHSVPFTIADDMINMLDSTDFFKEPDLTITASEYINSHRVIDISCKSGSLLFSFYKKFMVALRNVFPDRDDRDYFIVKNLLFGLCPSDKYLSMLRAVFYSNKKYDLSNELGNFYHYDFKDQILVDNKEVKELLSKMRFDVVCGNPPYNPDNKHNDFMSLGFNITKKYLVMIHPIGELLNLYSKNIANIVYYPDEGDIFTIKKPGGLVYYLIDKEKTFDTCVVQTKSMLAPKLNNISILNNLNNSSCLNSFGNIVIKKLGSFTQLHLKCDINDLYYVISSNMVAYCNSRQCPFAEKTSKAHGFFSTSGDSNVLPKLFDNINQTTDSSVGKKIFSSNDKNAINSFETYLETKFVKFLVFCGFRYTAIYDDFTFRFVPDPGSFDKVYEDKPLEGYTPDENGIYTDINGVVHCSLYVKYKLTDEEINVIESVIRERK